MTEPRPSIADRRRTFRAMHDTGCFILPNPWDPGGARYLQSLGFKAIATTSSGFAWSRRASGQRHHARDGARALARDGRGHRPAGERRLRRRLRAGRRRRRRKRAPCRRDGCGSALDRGLDRRCGTSAVRASGRRRTRPRRASCHRPGGWRHAARRAGRVLSRRPRRTSPKRSRGSRRIRTPAPIVSTRRAFARARTSRPSSRRSRPSPSIC